jgi:hypothetical protein
MRIQPLVGREIEIVVLLTASAQKALGVTLVLDAGATARRFAKCSAEPHHSASRLLFTDSARYLCNYTQERAVSIGTRMRLTTFLGLNDDSNCAEASYVNTSRTELILGDRI